MLRSSIILALLYLAVLGCHEPSPEGPPVLQVYLPPGGIEVGSPDTAFIVVEFGSFRCPYCRAFHDSLYPLLEREYFTPGKARYRFVNIDTALSFVRLASWVQCRTPDFLTSASEAFAIAAVVADSSSPDSLILPSMADDTRKCVEHSDNLRHEELARIRTLGIRAVPTFLVGAQAPDHGRIVGWVVEGMRDRQLLEAMRRAKALVYGPLTNSAHDSTMP